MNEFKGKIIRAILGIVLFTYVLAWLVSTPNSKLGILSIHNFQQSNDWIGFGGYILTSIIALWVYFGTSEQTREIQKSNIQIQNSIIKNQEDKALKNSRTSIEDTMIVTKYKLSDLYKEMLRGNKIILTEEYTYLDDLLKRDKDTYEKVVEDINDNKCMVKNVNQLNALIKTLIEHEKYIFRIIKNIGDNPMYNVKITLKGDWFMSGKTIDTDSKTFTIKYIGEKECVVLPLFKLDKNIKLNQFNVSETIVEYDTGSFGLRENMKVTLKYDPKEESIYENIDIQKLTEDCLRYKYEFMKYTYIS